MEIISSEIQAKEILKNYDDIVLVPTMGNLHAGHISLVNRAKKQEKLLYPRFL